MQQVSAAVVIERKSWHKTGTFAERNDIPADAVCNAPSIILYAPDEEIALKSECPVCHCTGGKFMPFIGMTKLGTVSWYRTFVVCRNCGDEREF
jgi:hypothetical protein